MCKTIYTTDPMFKTCDGTRFGGPNSFGTYPRYRLKKDIPGLRAGAVFELKQSPMNGLRLVLVDREEGYMRGDFEMPGGVAYIDYWFEKIPETNYLKESLLERIEALKKLVEKEFK